MTRPLLRESSWFPESSRPGGLGANTSALPVQPASTFGSAETAATSAALVEDSSSFIKGGHFTHVRRLEASNFVYKNQNGVAEDPFVTIMNAGGTYAQLDLNTCKTGCNPSYDLDDNLALVRRAKTSNAQFHWTIPE